MGKPFRMVFLICLVSLMLPDAAGASPSDYTMVELGTLGSGPYRYSFAEAINNRGQVVGYSAESIAAPAHLLLWDRDGNPTDLGTAPGAGNLQTIAINAQGTIVGTIVEGCELPGLGIPGFTCPSTGFMYERGEWRLILADGALASKVADINASGQVLGSDYHLDHGLRTFIFQDGHFTFLDGVALDEPAAINDRGQVVGWYLDDSYEHHPLLWSDGVATPIVTPGSFTVVLDLNNRGQVVGSYASEGARHAFTWVGGVTSDLPVPEGSWWSEAAAISDRGEVIGTTLTGLTSTAVIWDVSREATELASGCSATDLNDRGQVVGFCRSDYGPRAVLWER